MRKPVSRLLCLLLAALLLTGCASRQQQEEPAPPEEEPSAAPQEIVRGILASLGKDSGDLEEVTGEDADFYLTELYGLPEGAWEDAAICRAGGTEVFEIAVILLTESASREDALAGLESYREARQGDFTGYAPEQAAIAAQSRTASQGRCIALLLCEDPDTAQQAFAAWASGDTANLPSPPEPPVSEPEVPEEEPELQEPPETTEPEPLPESPAVSKPEPVTYPGRTPYVQPGIDDMTLYDSSALLAVWNGGNGTLSEEDAAILEAAKAVLAEVITEDMTPQQKERNVYRWLVGEVAYDQDHYNPLTGAGRNSYTPYSPLLEGKGVCLGFATTFQLLMDMCGVECITVVGAAFESREDHAWNMVRLDGNWYCVDPTWDCGKSNPDQWLYFNGSSDWMALTDHQWDYASVPEAPKGDENHPFG